MEYIINSRKLKKEITFSRPGHTYIYVNLNGKPGTLGRQICDHGRLSGSTSSYRGEDIQQFRNICHKWWREYLRKDKNW